MTIVNLFSGAGGWEARLPASLREQIVGVETDPVVTASATSNGLRVLTAAVEDLDPRSAFPGGVRALIASPPCPTFSTAGKGRGRGLLEWMVGQVGAVLDGQPVPSPPPPDPDGGAVAVEDAAKSMLTLEPCRWIAAVRPRWVLLEQVPPVLPVWQAMAEALRARGYAAAAWLLRADEYGVPQTRARAILVASRERAVHAPPATHHRFVPGAARPERTSDLFGAELECWVSMAEALGWDGDALVGFARRADDLAEVEMVTNARQRAAVRGANEPAPTITAGHDSAERRWRLRSNQSVNGGDRARRDVEAPSLTVSTRSDLWAWERPATTVAGDPRIHRPGHKENASDPPGVYGQRRGEHAIRVSVAEAATLQSFPPEWRWPTPRTRTFMAIGNAVPPLLAWHMLRVVEPDHFGDAAPPDVRAASAAPAPRPSVS